MQLLAPANGERVAVAEEYVLEEYLADAGIVGDDAFGDYVSIESAVAAGVAHHLAVTGKFALDPPYRETGNFMPSGLGPADEAAVVALADDAIRALGVQYGALHTEIKLTPDGPRIIELNARVGGGGIENIFGMAYGHSLQRIFAMTVLGIELPVIERQSDRTAYQLFVQCPLAAHRLVGIGGTDEVAALPGCRADRVQPPSGRRGRLARRQQRLRRVDPRLGGRPGGAAQHARADPRNAGARPTTERARGRWRARGRSGRSASRPDLTRSRSSSSRASSRPRIVSSAAAKASYVRSCSRTGTSAPISSSDGDES